MIVQKGVFNCCLIDARSSRSAKFVEQWLCKPKQVATTSAEALYPAVMEALPPETRLDDTAAIKKTMLQLSSLTIVMLADKASGNVLLLKRLAQLWQGTIAPKVGASIIIICESCCIHQHHRAEL